MAKTSKNLGLVQAIFVGTTPPSNTAQLWHNLSNGLPYYYNTLTSQWETLVGGGGGGPLSTTLALGKQTLGNDIVYTQGDAAVFENSGFNVRVDANTLNGNYTQKLQPKSGVIALLSDITAHDGNGIFSASNNGGAVPAGFSVALASTFNFSGGIGVGFGITPSQRVELGEGDWVALNSNASTTNYGGVRFQEVGFPTYGARMFQDGNVDRFIITTMNAGVDAGGIAMARGSGRVALFAGITSINPLGRLHVRGEGITSATRSIYVTDSVDDPTFRVQDDGTTLFGLATNLATRGNVEITGTGNGEINIHQAGTQAVKARITYSRATLGATSCKVYGSDAIGYSFTSQYIQSNNNPLTNAYFSSDTGPYQNGTFSNSDIRFGGNMSIRNIASGANEKTVASRLRLESLVSATINDYDPGADNLHIFGIANQGWMLHIDNTGANVDTETAALGVVTQYNIVKIERIGISAANGGVGSTVTYTEAASLRIEGAPTNDSSTDITNPYALYIVQDESYFGGNVTLANLPVAAAGLPTGGLWNNAGVVNIAP